jgi:hypothetical protein
MTGYIQNFAEFLNEGKVMLKRKYTEAHPAKHVFTYAPVREKILSFVKEKGEVSHDEMMEYVKGINEETGGNTSRKWLTKNAQYFTIKEKNGEKTYKLSSLGEKVHSAINKLNEI